MHMRWMNGVGRAAVVVAGAMAVLGDVREAQGTVSSTLVADTYNVVDGARTYAVLDVYVVGNHVADAIGGSVLGVGTHSVIFATSAATGTGLVRDSAGKLTAGTITNDIFVQSSGSSWLPTNEDGKGWDSFIAVGNRSQAGAASVTNRAGTVKNQGLAANMTAASGFTQMNVPNSNFINNGTTGGWYSALGGNPYITGGAAENPYARVSLYNAYWNGAYPSLNRTGMLVTKGKKQSGRAAAGVAAVWTGDVGASLEFCWMVGRFAIDVTGMSSASIPNMQVQFSVVGKNGANITGNENGTTFTGATTAAYKVSQFFSFSANDCNNNGIDDGLDLNPPTTVTTGNMGTLAGATTRTVTKSVSALSTGTVTVSVDALGDLDSTSEYLIVRLSNPPTNTSGIVRNMFLNDGLACPTTPQRATFTLTKEEFNGLLGNAPGSLKIDVTPTAGVGGADSTCQASSSVAVSIEYVAYNSTIDCNSNGVIDSCEIASGAATDCNSNGIPDSCDIASGLETDLNGNGKADRCEYLVGSPAWPTVAGAVSAAPAGGTVLVLPGTYDGPVDLGSKGLTLRSTGGKGNTTIRAAAGATAIRVAGGGRVEGFFIQGGAGDTQTGTRRGGAMVITGGDVTVKDCDLRAGDTGSAGEGGLVFIRNAQPTFDTCRLEFGFAGSGGGVYAIASDAAQFAPVFTNCIVRSNNAGIGGGMLLRGSGMRPVLQGVLFELNQASGAGGALAMLDGARPTLNGCKACGNTAVVVSGAYDVAGALSYLTDDCNGDGVCDADQIAAGQLTDLDVDGIPDTCQDCDGDGYSDRYAIAQGMVPDCDGNLLPDACDLAAGAPDCNGNGVPDACDARSTALDCNRDGVVDSCQALPDCNANGVPDVCDIAGGLLPDCNSNGVPDGCEVASGAASDCNANGIPDACDIAAGREEDQDGGGVPDACQYAVGDLDLDGATNTGDLAFILLLFDSPGPIGDLDGDGMVSTADVSLMLLYFE